MKRQTQEKIQALRELLLKQEQEAMRLALLENLLKAELTKNASDIDTDFADFLSQEIENCTERTVHPARCRRTGTRRCMAIAVAALLVLCVAAGTIMPNQAGAFSLVRIMRFLTPLAQQFGITVNTDDGKDIAVTKSETVYVVEPEYEVDGSEEFVYFDIHDVPEHIGHYPTKPATIPDGWVFKRADYYSDLGIQTLCSTYVREGEEFYIRLTVYSDNVGGSAYLAESSLKASIDQPITVTENEGVTTVFMKVNFGSYMIWGKVPSDILLQIMNDYKGDIENA